MIAKVLRRRLLPNYQVPISPLSPIYVTVGDFSGEGKLDLALTSSVGPFNGPTGI